MKLCKDNTALLYFWIFIFENVTNSVCDLFHVQSFNGSVAAENFTYYKLVLEGHVFIKLQSFEGDADLYVSSETMQPTWKDYMMKSDTCSNELVVVDKYLERPIGIGVYGYVQYAVSKYQLSVYIERSVNRYYPEEEKTKSTKKPLKTNHRLSDSANQESSESLLWNILIYTLQFLLEVLL